MAAIVGLLIVVGFSAIGWFKTWARPDYKFVLIYGLGVLAAGTIFGLIFGPFVMAHAWITWDLYIPHLWLVPAGVIAAALFAVPALCIVAIRRHAGHGG